MLFSSHLIKQIRTPDVIVLYMKDRAYYSNLAKQFVYREYMYLVPVFVHLSILGKLERGIHGETLPFKDEPNILKYT